MWDCRCVFYCIHAKRERARRARRYQPSNLASNPPSKVTFSFIIPTVAPVPENEVFLFLFFINCSNSNHSMSFLLVFFEYYCLFLITSYTHTYIHSRSHNTRIQVNGIPDKLLNTSRDGRVLFLSNTMMVVRNDSKLVLVLVLYYFFNGSLLLIAYCF